uniref:Glutaredoxin domain-containing protein n=1 Tax=Calcidiscus leptoporus TaxID=127549 RepID=A0A7S0J4D4_9EUKA|mmetsp:Transcript_38270/g.89570  ORF Transcript_38270/g.89570 Transcript_38270/m.89570 type:complete len:134 (+) Transcript_38270:143-544(+)|eukprot:CAMPEP_0119363904 /NCGR_PEP_ID=MMETSP1334-20130426/10824_1 /TAXON_ID=127549 /ORGANISM="Calcidiscus leptoporus, Strain RCC1130" /LENGTH=133 /DNA_ID=CAMNT_0007379477 /DNA_START=164 /DNA_END=565 /DNA_ORIENTATION=+
MRLRAVLVMGCIHNYRGDGTFSLASIAEELQQKITANKVVIFSSSSCPVSTRVKTAFEDLGLPYHAVELDQQLHGKKLRETLYRMTGTSKTPTVFVSGRYMKNVEAPLRSGELAHWVSSESVPMLVSGKLVVK